jgi:hypothetical protein
VGLLRFEGVSKRYTAGTREVLAADLDAATGLLLVDEAEACLADADGRWDAWADEVASLTPLARARRAGVPVLLAAPLVGAAVASLIFKIG